MSDAPWTWKQFMAAMRRAGWKNIGQGAFIHNETGARFDGWTWTRKRADKYDGRGEAWIPFAIDHTTPTEAPF